MDFAVAFEEFWESIPDILKPLTHKDTARWAYMRGYQDAMDKAHEIITKVVPAE